MKNYLFLYDVKEKKVKIRENLPFTVKINDVKVNSHENSFVSSACVNGNGFSAAADYWGINTHYYYHNDTFFVCSSSLHLLLQQLIGIELSRKDVFDFLFFGYSYEGRTLFEGVKRLKASETLWFDGSSGQFGISGENNFEDFFALAKNNPDAERLQKVLDCNFKDMEPNEALIGLSAGSDTRTILATLLHYKVNPTALSFGDDKSLELKNIEALCQKTRIPLNTINSRIEPDNYIGTLKTYTEKANYLVSGQNVHVVNLFQKQLKEPGRIFMGFLGSEFVKGALSEAMISYPFQDLIKGKSAKEIAEQWFKHLTHNVRKELAEHISASIIPRVFPDPDRNACLVRFCFSHLPANFFAGSILYGQDQGYGFVLPYLSRSILEELFSSDLGLIHNNNFMADYSVKKSFQFEALWIKLMSPQLYHSFIPQYGASFFGLGFLPKKVRSARTALNLAIGKYYYKRPFHGQIERGYLEEAKRKHIAANYDHSMVSSLLNFDYTDSLKRIDLDNLNHIILCEGAVQ